MERRVVLSFPPSSADKPLVGHLVRRYRLDINILRASINPRAEGKMLLALSGDSLHLERGLAFLSSHGVVVQAADEQVSIDTEACVHCGACTAVCALGALRIGPSKWELSYEGGSCVGCQACVPVCPVKAITPLMEDCF